MIASASVAPAAGPETMSSSGTRRGGTQSAGATPRSFEHSLRDARSQHDRVPDRQERRDDGRSAESRPAAARDRSARPDAATRSDGRGRADASGGAVDVSPTSPAVDASIDEAAAALTTPASADASSATTADESVVATTLVTPTTAVAASVGIPMAAGSAPAAATATPSPTTATPVSSMATGAETSAAGAVAVVVAEALDASGHAAQSRQPALSAAPAAARADATASALTVAADSPTAPTAADASPSTRPQDGASVPLAPTSPAGRVSLTVTADSVAAGVRGAAATTTAGGTRPSGAEGAAAQAVAAPTTSAVGQPVASPAPATSTAPAAPVPAWLQQAVQAQLSGRLVAAARGSEPGTVQRLTLHLHPADLGSVQVVATVDDGTVSLQLAAGNPTTRDALRASLATLRSDLVAAGLDGVRLDVSDQPPSSHHGAAHQQGPGADGSARHPGSPVGQASSTAAGPRDRGHDVAGQVRGRSHPSQGVDLQL